MQSVVKTKAAALGLVLLGAIVMPLLAWHVDPGDYTGGRSRDMEQRTIRNSSALATMFGELRTSISDIMFLKTERYLHSGVAYVPHHEAQLLSVEEMGQEVEAHQSEVGAEEGGTVENPSHAGTKTVIPAQEADYRGIVGILHRRVKPWRDPGKAHLHTDGTELLPWFRMMTLNDPNYVMGYAIGGWWVSLKDREAALAFLEEGLEKNPDAFQIRLTRGLVLLRSVRQQKQTAPGTLDGLRDELRLAAEQGLAQRPAAAAGQSVTEQPGWSVFKEQDLWTACQTAVLLEQQYGDPSAAAELAARYLRTFPDNPVLARIASDAAAP